MAKNDTHPAATADSGPFRATDHTPARLSRPGAQITAVIERFSLSGLPVLGRVQALIAGLALVSNLARCRPASSAAHRTGPVDPQLVYQAQLSRSARRRYGLLARLDDLTAVRWSVAGIGAARLRRRSRRMP